MIDDLHETSNTLNNVFNKDWFIKSGNFMILQSNTDFFAQFYNIKFDQLIIIRFTMTEVVLTAHCSIYNEDYSAANMCGNLIRALGLLGYQKFQSKETTVCFYKNENVFKAKYIHGATPGADYLIKAITSGTIPVTTWSNETITLQENEIIEYIEIGNKHIILRIYSSAIWNNEMHLIDLVKKIKESFSLASEANFSFIYINDKQDTIEDGVLIKAKVYENGVGFTGSCGSAATAIMLSMHKTYGLSYINIEFPGGEMSVSYENNHVVIQGECEIKQLFI